MKNTFVLLVTLMVSFNIFSMKSDSTKIKIKWHKEDLKSKNKF
ncbi:hypothetical protein SAMN06265379_11436 [Saccharicrinis carchari]|uniref:Uncharacterized protein n=1 Tax=Saccharicrinis carchari TaxID=1168039 RepID=A0A521F562_SACCC|nr:hypothetical protein SAMN06265379_11436 [Saccharicrinis carchari]